MLAVEISTVMAAVKVTEQVELVLLQEVGSGAYFAVEPSYIEQDVDVLLSPYNNGAITLADTDDKGWPSSLYVVTGRYYGDMGDTTHIVEAENDVEASSIFIDKLREEHGHTEEQTAETPDCESVFVGSICILQEAIKQRLK